MSEGVQSHLPFHPVRMERFTSVVWLLSPDIVAPEDFQVPVLGASIDSEPMGLVSCSTHGRLPSCDSPGSLTGASKSPVLLLSILPALSWDPHPPPPTPNPTGWLPGSSLLFQLLPWVQSLLVVWAPREGGPWTDLILLGLYLGAGRGRFSRHSPTLGP